RMQTLEQTRAIIEGGRRRGVESVNVDLIYGLPYQTPEGFAATLREVIALAPDRLALFNFAYLPQMFPHQKTIRPETLPDPESKLRMLEEAIAALTSGAGGYVFIGMDHFARPDDPLAQALRDRTLTRNFQGYSTCAETDLVAFGVSSISEVAGGYAQNVKTLGEYRSVLEAGRFPTCRGLLRSREDELRRDVIVALMCHFRVDKAAIEARHLIDFDTEFAAELERLEPMADDGLVEIEPGRIEVTPRGRLLVRNIAMEFDGYLQASNASRYSRTVWPHGEPDDSPLPPPRPGNPRRGAADARHRPADRQSERRQEPAVQKPDASLRQRVKFPRHDGRDHPRPRHPGGPAGRGHRLAGSERPVAAERRRPRHPAAAGQPSERRGGAGGRREEPAPRPPSHAPARRAWPADDPRPQHAGRARGARRPDRHRPPVRDPRRSSGGHHRRPQPGDGSPRRSGGRRPAVVPRDRGDGRQAGH